MSYSANSDKDEKRTEEEERSAVCLTSICESPLVSIPFALKMRAEHRHMLSTVDESTRGRQEEGGEERSEKNKRF